MSDYGTCQVRTEYNGSTGFAKAFHVDQADQLILISRELLEGENRLGLTINGDLVTFGTVRPATYRLLATGDPRCVPAELVSWDNR